MQPSGAGRAFERSPFLKCFAVQYYAPIKQGTVPRS